jgi:acetylornithine deacetylase/succinyl-diaminopimelate desuccinylase-like protein
MHDYLEQLPALVEAVESIRETVITNVVLIGQVPAPTFREKRRIQTVLERMAELQVDEVTTDGYRNPVGILHGTDRSKPPIFAVAHLDTFSAFDAEVHYTVGENAITGPGVTDNSVGVGVLLSLPQIFRQLGLRFASDIVLAGVIQSLGRGNLRGIRHLLKNWAGPIRGAVVLEGIELGRLNYSCDGMIRSEITCNVATGRGVKHRFKPNAILVLNEVINQILQLRLPQRPPSRVIFGKISGGVKHGDIALNATLGLEIQSKEYGMVKAIQEDIRDIAEGISHEHEVEVDMKTVSNVHAARLRYNHPLVKAAGAVIKRLGMKPMSSHSESELSIFLNRKIPAVTLGITRGDNYHTENAVMEIEPMARGVAQVIATLMAIDNGVCDEAHVA